MGQDGWSEQITEETSSLSSTDESVIKHTNALKHKHAHTHIIPRFLSTLTGMSSSPCANVKRAGGEKSGELGKTVGSRKESEQGVMMKKEGVEKMIAVETNKGFPSDSKEREEIALSSHALPSLLLHQWMSSSIIMHSFIVLLFCQCMNSLVYREKMYLPPLFLCLSLSPSPSLFLLFHIFKCQLYLCGLPALRSFDVFSSSVSGFCV